MELTLQPSTTYQQSFPPSWRSVPLGSIASITSGGTPNRSNPAYWNGEIPWVTTSQIDGGLITECDEYISELGLRNSAAQVLAPGTILMAMYGQGKTRGKVSVLGIHATTNQACAAIALSRDVQAEFVFQYLVHNYEAIRGLSNAGSQENLSGQIIRTIPVLLPPPEEQRAIAAALSEVDDLVAALDALIEKKRAVKTAAMQRLLTGRQRLPGFSGEWETKRLDQIGEIESSGVDKKVVQGEAEVRLVNYMDVYRRDLIYSADLGHWVTAPSSKATRCAVQKGDVFFTPSSETPDDIAHSAVAMEDISDAVYSYHVVRLRLREDWDLRFRAYAFKTKAFLDQASTVCAGSGTRYVISKAQFKALEVLVPPTSSEQRAIAEILSDMDAEVAALEARREKTRMIKQGMMQELLTGRTRLV